MIVVGVFFEVFEGGVEGRVVVEDCVEVGLI